jgi:hypothetical protein
MMGAAIAVERVTRGGWKRPGALGASVLAVVVGCQATRHAASGPAGAGPNAMLDATTVGQHRCATGAEEGSPFVVEWDATDLASFEALAARDLVLVKYQDCSIELVTGCSDAGVPGLYGRYAEPTFTSGTVESFTMANEDELYAKLPLGAVAFSGNVKSGETLELRYFVSGLVRSTRDQVYRATLDANPRCAGATHFVAQYNLGAFRLLAHKSLAAGAEGNAKALGAHARTSRESANLKEGGDLDSCESTAQRQCRVPIRLVLRKISEAAPPAAAAPTPVAAGISTTETAYQLRRAAKAKLEAGDGKGCLEDFDRADALESSEQGRVERGFVASQCKMAAGDCEGGKQDLAEFYRAQNKDRRQTEAEIQRTVQAFAIQHCPTAQLPTVEAKISHLAVRISAAKERGDAATCSSASREIEALAKTVSADEKTEVAGLLIRVVDCLDELERCDEARATFDRYFSLAVAPRLGAEESRALTAAQLYQPQRCPKP